MYEITVIFKCESVSLVYDRLAIRRFRFDCLHNEVINTVQQEDGREVEIPLAAPHV